MPPNPPPFTLDTTNWRITNLEGDMQSVQNNERKLSDTLLIIGIKIETGLADLSNRIKVFEEKKTFWNKVLAGVLTGVGIIIIGFAMKLSYIVQSNKLGP